jgi:hypothetical protein
MSAAPAVRHTAATTIKRRLVRSISALIATYASSRGILARMGMNCIRENGLEKQQSFSQTWGPNQRSTIASTSTEWL